MSESPEELKIIAGNLAAALPGAVAAIPKRTLADLVQHMGYLADTNGAVPEDMLAEFQKEVQETLLAKGEKVDSYAKLIHYYSMRAASAKAELDTYGKLETERLKKRVARFENDARRLGDAALYVISLMPRDKKGKLQRLEGVNYTLSAAGVADSCEVYDESKVPDEFKDVEFTSSQPLSSWKTKAIQDCIVSVIPWKLTYSVDKKRLLAALKEACGQCLGKGAMSFEDGSDPANCGKCNGTGHRLIPGAKLLTGKLRLVNG